MTEGKKEVFLKVKRKNLFFDTKVKETTSVLELKKIVQGHLGVSPNNQQLYNMEKQLMEDDKLLRDYGYNSSIANTAESPAAVGLALRQFRGDFEDLDCTDYGILYGCVAPPQPEVFLKVKRKNLFFDTKVKETTSVLELKKIVQGHLGVSPNNQQLYNMEKQLMEDDKLLRDYGYNSSIANTAESPAPVGLAFRQFGGDFEVLDCTDYGKLYGCVAPSKP